MNDNGQPLDNAIATDDENLMPMNMTEFIERFKPSIIEQIVNNYRPEYLPDEDEREWTELLRAPLGGQVNAVRGASLSLQTRRGTTVVGEMGTGKTFIAIAAAQMAGMRRVLVLCPGHLTDKWRREVMQTAPGATAVVVESITELERLREFDCERGPVYAILGNNKAKLGGPKRPAYVSRRARRRVYDRRGNDTGETRIVELMLCPSCYSAIADKRGDPVEDPAQLSKRRMTCLECGEPLWQEAGFTKKKKFPLGEYVKKRMRGFFDLFVADEVHEYKAKDSAQGIIAGVLAASCKRTLSLTGTFMGGYSSTLFYLLYRLSSQIRDEFGYGDESRWIDRYGFRERIVKRDPDDGEYGARTRSRKRSARNVERPGITPAALFQILPGTVFLRLADVAPSLPEYSEDVLEYGLDTTDDEITGYSQATGYNHLSSEMREALVEALKNGSARLLGAYLQSLLSYPDGCVQGERVVDPATKELIVSVPPLPADRLYPKEEALIDLVEAERKRGRRTLVYVTHTETRDITGRLRDALASRGLRAVVMKSGNPDPNKREQWLADRVEEGLDALICHPKLVQTGLDLLDFPTIVWYETEYSVYTMRQASRRSWRIGQTEPVRVVYMSYRGTLQSDALRLVAQKMQASLAVEGDLPDEGLAALGDSGDNLFMQLARSIVSGETIEGSLDDMFAAARVEQSDGAGLMVDDDWNVAPEIVESVAVELPAEAPNAVESDGRASIKLVKPPVEPVKATAPPETDDSDRNPVEETKAPPSALSPQSTRSGFLVRCPSCGVFQFPFGMSEAPFQAPPDANSVVACQSCDARMLVEGTDPDAPIIVIASEPEPAVDSEPDAPVEVVAQVPVVAEGIEGVEPASPPPDQVVKPDDEDAVAELARHFEELDAARRERDGTSDRQGNLFSALLF